MSNIVNGKKGAPPAFRTVEALEKKIEEYYKYCEKKEKPLTIAGIANFLGIDRLTFANYGKKDDFAPVIRKARRNILADLEERMITEGKRGQIFVAKNYGYDDTQKITNTSEITLKNGNNLDNLSDNELEQLKYLLEKTDDEEEE